MTFEPGMKIGKYELKKQLGEGGFGMVFVAWDIQLKRDVALKFLLARHTANADLMQRFLKEAETAAGIGHQGIVTVYESGQIANTGTPADGSGFIAMELLKGNSLAERLLDHHALAPAIAIEITRQIAHALGAAHEVGVVHRDLKPDNVFLVPDRATLLGERVKVLDFGIAKVVDTGSGSSSGQTGSQIIFGTPRYMSPEQCRSTTNVDARTDIYALGVMLFEMLAGERPYEGEPGVLIAMHQLAPIPALRKIAAAADVDERLEALVTRMLAKAPAERPGSMDAVIAELDALAPRPASVVTAVLPGSDRKEPGSAHQIEPTRALPSSPPARSTVGTDPTMAPPADVPPTQVLEPSQPPQHSVPSQVTPSRTSPAQPVAALSAEPAPVPPTALVDRGNDRADRLRGDRPVSRRGFLLAAIGLVPVVGLVLYFAFHKSEPVTSPTVDAGVTPPPADTAPPIDTPIAPTPPPGMVYIPAADLKIGSSEAEIDEALALCKSMPKEYAKDCKRSLYERERPEHAVHVSAFFLDQYERTNADVAEWLTGVRATVKQKNGALWIAATEIVEVRGSDREWPRGIEQQGTVIAARDGYADRPAIYITHAGARAFCRSRGAGWDLPSEAQWERAARGPERRAFPWGNDAPTCELAAYGFIGNPIDGGRFDPRHPPAGICPGTNSVDAHTATRDRTPEGVMHLAGNVAEWVVDQFQPTFPPCPTPCIDPVHDPETPPTEGYVFRGGSFVGWADQLRGAGRNRSAVAALPDVGFRCAAPAPAPAP